MFDKNILKKVSSVLWEISKSYRRDMKVPARVYATEKMLDDIVQDRSLDQLVNFSTLPGVVGNVLAMPDVHEGYGAPIGGVAAMLHPDGVISPGAVGYDINCLHPDTKVYLPFGATISIKSLVEKKFNEVCILNKRDKQLINIPVIGWQSRKENKSLYHITSKFGFSIKATGDHPFYSDKGMIDAKKLKVGENLVIDPFVGVNYEKPKSFELINLNFIIEALKALGFENNGNRFAQIVSWFKRSNFLNLRLDDWRIPYLVKIIGLLFGDGTMNFVGKLKKGQISFYGNKEDLISLKSDLSIVGIKSSVYSRKRNNVVKNHYKKEYKFSSTEHSLHIGSSACTLLFYLLGCPLGNKTQDEISVPSWIIEHAPMWQQRLFLAAFFGAEMSTPKMINKYNFYSQTLNINKAVSLKNNGVKFLEDIKNLLSAYGIKSSSVVEVEGLSNKETIGLRFHVLSASENLIRFYKTIGFEYHREKKKLANLAICYLQWKKSVVELRKQTRVHVRTLYGTGVSINQLKMSYAQTYVSGDFIERSVWNSGRDEPRIAFDFPSFADFLQNYAYGDDGLVMDEVVSMEKEPFKGLVFDITVNHIDHNFIANGFVVSNCGVRLVRSDAVLDDIKNQLSSFAREIYHWIPSGVGRGGKLKLTPSEIDAVLKHGVKWMVDQGYANKDDIRHIESFGCLDNADPTCVSERAKQRGHDQLGTLGAGNHFAEVDFVEEIYDEDAAKSLNLKKNQIVFLIHTGSRGLGHQVATDYIKLMMDVMSKYGIELPDRELACAPFSSKEGTDYFNAMAAAANFAWSNRQLITWEMRNAWKREFGESVGELSLVYDVAHNMAKMEEHEIDGKKQQVIMHRKGATRAFGPGHPEIAEEYRAKGQPVLIPGSMGTASYVLMGTNEGMKESFGSCCHGAGRRMSRHAAKKIVHGKELKEKLLEQGIHIVSGSVSRLAEEAPLAYKDVDEVVEVVHTAGIAKKVAKLRPCIVVKG
ncbi:RtcB family protein [Candidatus Babeliales bacterium]|nr:RtcB family protein [Candidatus Babeliales bacterium]